DTNGGARQGQVMAAGSILGRLIAVVEPHSDQPVVLEMELRLVSEDVRHLVKVCFILDHSSGVASCIFPRLAELLDHIACSLPESNAQIQMLVRRELGRDCLAWDAFRLEVPGRHKYAAAIRNLINHTIHTELNVKGHPSVGVHKIPSSQVP